MALFACIPSLSVLESRCDAVGGRMGNRQCLSDTAEDQRQTDTGTPIGPPDATPSQYVFVTEERFDGSLGGLSGGDAKCQLSADRAGMPGTYVAWLSTSNVDARQRIEGEGPWRNRVGWTETVIFEEKSELVQFPAATINGDAVGGFHEGASSFSLGDTWTGTLADGTKHGADCYDWTSSDNVNGLVGSIRYEGEEWTEYQTDECFSERRLYCFSTDVVTWPFPETLPTTTN